MAQVRKTAKATGVQPLRDAIMTLLCVELEKILGPSKLPKAPKPLRIKPEPKPPSSLSRVPGVEKNIALGLELLALRATIKSNCAFGRQVRRQFDVEGQHAGEVMKVARAYGTRPEIFTRLSWIALLTLASPSMPPAVRQGLEARTYWPAGPSSPPTSAGPAGQDVPSAQPISQRGWRRSSV